MSLPPHELEARKRSIAGVFDRGAGTYDQVGVDFFAPAARDVVARAALRPGERVLDIGTGRGAVLFAAADAVGAQGRAVGIDISSRMAELTQAEAAARGLENVTAMQGDAEQPEFADGSFDAVLAGLAIFFLPDPAAALRRYAALLKPGGRVAFSTFGDPDANFEAAMRAIGRHVRDNMPNRDERQGPFGSPAGIRQIVTANGFAEPVIDEVSYESRFADTDHWMSWVWSHGGRWTLERVPQESLDEATQAAKAAFEAARTPEGDYAIRTELRFTVARRAAD
ncbi:MAG TPA: methyltransferase domain-containing protein [Jatrophihabitans sp.]|nr:methyltransferase domain-containing protein [Jatrophihabitans sp.]